MRNHGVIALARMTGTARRSHRSVPMRRLVASTFASLDGIMQAPGGPEEDPTGGFALGGWMFWGLGRKGRRVGARGRDLRYIRTVLALPAR